MLRAFNRTDWLRRVICAGLFLMVPAAHSGDILRGGAGLPGGRTKARTASGSSGTKTAGQLQSNAKDRLARTNAALDAVKAMQKAARSAKNNARLVNPNGGGKLPRVTDGLGKNGLQIDPRVPKNLNKPKAGEDPSLWVGAKLPTETGKKGGEKNVTIVQTEQQALLNWETFNIGKKTTLTFDQSKGGSDTSKWVAFNKVNDPKGRPSQILGSLKADGQVYVINQNGIIFGATSQVNTHTLVASALPINNNLIASGLLNNPNAEFLFDTIRKESLGQTASIQTLRQIVDPGSKLKLSYSLTNNGTGTLIEGTDYTTTVGEDRVTTVTLTAAGLAKLNGTDVVKGTLAANYVALHGDVTVERGAQLTAPTTPQKVGGRIALVGGNVRNSGTISTPDGQTILAAGLQVGFGAHSSDDPSLRGLDTFIGAVSDSTAKQTLVAGTAINDGLIEVPRANATITGKSVQQNGVIDSSTSVSLNGRIDLDAAYDYISNPEYDATSTQATKRVLFVPKSTGIVTLGEDSVTRILPELASDERIASTELPIASQINTRGLAINFAKNATVLAPNANVTAKAGLWEFTPGTTGQPPFAEFVYSSGQIYADRGATIDVAGTTGVEVAMAERILTLELRGSQLADSPLQRDGVLRGIPITIDARLTGTFNGKTWVGTPLGDASGFLGLIERNAAQLTANGGSVDFQAGDSVVLNKGAVIDVSGGWLKNEGGLVKTTKVIQGSRLIDIADATPDQVYDGIYDPKFTQTHSKWGITKTYRNPLDLNGGHYEESYIQGADGGSIAIVAPSMALDGKLTGNTVTGPRQVRQNAHSSSLPAASKLSLTFRSDDPDPLYGEAYSPISRHAPKVVFGDVAQPAALPFALNAEGSALAIEGDESSNLVNPFQLRTKRRDLVVLSPTLFTESGFGSLTVDNGAGDIVLPAGISLVTPVEGSITLKGRNINVQGNITAPGGSLDFTSYNLSPYFAAQYKNRGTDPFVVPFAAEGAGRFTLGADAFLDTSGLVLDERINSDTLSPVATKGGAIKITAYQARLAAGSLVDVSGGALVDTDSHVSYGAAGSISILAGKDPNLAALFPEPKEAALYPDRLLGGRLVLGGELRGYSGTTGGSLTLQAPFVQVGGKATEPGTLLLQPEFFDQGGFASFDLSGIGGARFGLGGKKQTLPGLVIAADTVIAPRALSLSVDPMGGANGGLEVTTRLQPRGLRTPVSLGFHSLGLANDVGLTGAGLESGIVARGDLIVGAGVDIRTDPLAKISFTGTTVSIEGRVSAPAGAITVTGSSSSANAFEQDVLTAIAMPTVYLGSESLLSTAGTTVLVPDHYGRRVGSVLAGGTISVAGNIVAANGAVLDVSGASGVLDFSPLALNPDASRRVSARSGLTAPLQALQTVPARVDSDGGTITLAGGEMLFTDATLYGRAGGTAAAGGTLNVSSRRFATTDLLPTDVNLIVTQSNRTIPVAPLPSLFGPGEQTPIGVPVLNKDGERVPALGYFAADKFLQGGFDSLSLGGVVRFKGPVTIDARGSIKVATEGVLYADDRVNLSASYVALGMPFRTPLQLTDSKFPFTAPTNPYNFGPTHGPGTLTVEADLIDIGNLSLRNMRFANFIARDGDIRGSGTLNIAGNLRFEAGQIYAPTALSFTAVAYDYPGKDHVPGADLKQGSVVIKSSGTRQIPLSAGGTLSFYASNIEQSGVLRAPMGTINLGWDGTGAAPIDYITGSERGFPVTKKLVLGPQSITSVAAVDSVTGEGILIPYGLSLDGNTWIDPTGLDATAGGLPTKDIHLSATKLITKSSSEIDLRGGGDLYAYRWVGGLGGTTDILASDSSFAVIPTYDSNFAPIGAYNDNATVTAFNRDPSDPATRDAGYVNPTLSVGDRVYLGASEGLAAGSYTLLPARYALLPGAFLVTPKDGATIGATLSMPDGSSIVSGYRFNSLNASVTPSSVFSRFEVASQSVVRTRAQYDNFTANRFLRDTALKSNTKPQTLPIDSGHLVFQATEAMRLNGAVHGEAPFGGRGAFIDVSSPADIIIAGADKPKLSKEEAAKTIVLKSSRLSGWGAESLLVGGIRSAGEEGTVVTVNTGNLTVDNEGSVLSAPEIILAADKTLTVADGARIEQSGSLTDHADALSIDGNGTLLRVSSDPRAAFSRINVTDAKDVKMTIGENALIVGNSLTLDSSYATSLSPKAVLRGRTVNLSSGQISLRLDDSGELQPTDGLVLAGRALRSLQSSRSLSLLSYSSIDIYGSGEVGSRILDRLELHAGEIRGFNTGGGVASFRADEVLLDNTARGVSPGKVSDPSGTFEIRADTIELGNRRLNIDQFAKVELNATGGIQLGGKGWLFVDGELDVRTPAFFAAGGATETIRATGALQIRDSGTAVNPGLTSGLGASLKLTGSSVVADSDIFLPSGQLALHASSGDVNVNGRLDVGGTAQRFNDLIKYTGGGQISLRSDQGDVNLGRRGILDVAADKGGASAGSVMVSAAKGTASFAGTLFGQGGAKGKGGNFSLDAASLPAFAKLAGDLNDAAFTESRNFRIRQGDVIVSGTSNVRNFSLSADQGSISVTGKIDASGDTGGTIRLAATEDVVLTEGAVLTVAAKNFDNAGKGGAVTLEAGSASNGMASSTAMLDIQSGSLIDLSVASANEGSEALGQFTGTLHLRAPQNSASTDLQIGAINGTIKNASSIIAEGYKLFDLTPTNGVVDTSVRNNIRNNGVAFIGADGTPSAGYAAMLSRLLANNAGLDSVFSIRTGAELYRPSGNITIGASTGNAASAANGDFDLATFRFGPKSAPGILTIRAPGNLIFLNALSDGFVSSRYDSVLLNANPNLPFNAQSWSYRLAAGADLSAADFRNVMPLSQFGPNEGSLLLGRFNGTNSAGAGTGTTSGAVQGTTAATLRYQVIRTGSGNIEISTARDLQLRNHFATIYTAGTKISDPTMGGAFDLPVTPQKDLGGNLGSAQQPVEGYLVQYTLGGGNVSIQAQGDISHVTLRNNVVVADSQRQLPMNWLYRRGYVDPATGTFGTMPVQQNTATGDTFGGDVASTSWWIDFSNFFEGVGALGGGNVSLVAGNNISNVDAVIPTNARLPKAATSSNELVELGGGDLLVRAGRDIDGGVYYVERGRGVLDAGNEIKTNETRAQYPYSLRGGGTNPPGAETWLPTTLFLGKGGFDVSARGNLLLGPVSNPFLLPSGLNNSVYYKTWFSTYAPASEVNVSSLGGAVTLRTRAAISGGGSTIPLLQAWLQTQLVLSASGVPTTSAYYQPWLRLSVPGVSDFATATSIMPPTLRATSFTGDLNLVGTFNLAPATRGTLEFAAAGAINGLQPTGNLTGAGTPLVTWGTTRINLSDANPGVLPSIVAPVSYRAFNGPNGVSTNNPGYLDFLTQAFAETGSLSTVLQTKQALHAPGPLHAGDSEPLRLYALTGDISGITLFSPKAARIVAGQDITDNGFYIQNVDASDISVVAAGRNILAYNASSPLRTLSQAPGNQPPGFAGNPEAPLSGDIQLAGPGVLAVLAGGSLDLGTGLTNDDGTGAGIMTVGNARNPYLPFEGASVIAAAGIGPATGISDSLLDFEGFTDEFLLGGSGEKYLAEIDPTLTEEKFLALPTEQRDRIALEAFYLVLRDSGRDATKVETEGTSADGGASSQDVKKKGYDLGYAAIASLFPVSADEEGKAFTGNIDTRARNIRTKNGGDISVLAPHGELTLATSVVGNPLVPPGIITESGGNVSIFTDGDVDIGIGRIFTLKGGNMVIWSSTGNIAAGAASKTVKSAPPTRVLIDPQSADVQTDLAGLSTGGGIGVLATVAGVAPGDVDLIAPVGVVDAGDAGIRVSGNLNIAATAVLNASNIAVTGSTTGVPTAPVVAAPNVAGLTSASNTAGASTQAAESFADQARKKAEPEETPSVITVEVVGFGDDQPQASL